MKPDKPSAEVLVEGELSPFEHEALYQLLRKHFSVSHPVYKDTLDETVGTRVNVIFSHSYDRSFFTEIFRDGWRELKDLFKQISYRRGRLGASFNIGFSDQKFRLTFSTGVVSDHDIGSAMDQLAHLTGVIGQMLRPETAAEPLGQVEASYDRKTDRWQGFRGVGLKDQKEYTFDESLFRWIAQ